MTERKKLSLGTVSERAREVTNEPSGAWKVSEKRQAALKERARDQRRNPSEAQRALWARIDDKQTGFTFNREVIMGSSIVDFACKTRWLVVEIGGTAQDGDDAEATRAELSDRKLRDVGVRVMRFANAQVLDDTDAVVAAIQAELEIPFERPQMNKAASAPGDRHGYRD